MLMLKQSTAVTLKIGPFVDEDDGKTAETGLTISQADVRLSKNGANIAQKNESTTCTHDELGIYGCPIDATDTATLGRLQLFVHESGALPVWHEFMVMPSNVWDSLFGADALQVHANEITAGLITAAAVATGAIDADAIADNAIDAGAIASNAITAAKIASNAITAAKIATDAITAAKIAADAIGLSEVASALIDAINAQDAGAGAITFTYTLTSSVDSSVITGADVWATSDSGGNTVVASGTTNASGQVVFYLDAGTYYIWAEKSGWNFTNPDTEAVA